MSKTYAIALALLAGSLSGCGKAEDPRPLVISLLLGVPPEAESFTAITQPRGTQDFALKTTTGDEYTVEVGHKTPAKPGEPDKVEPLFKLTLGKVVDPCKYAIKLIPAVGSETVWELDFKQFEGVKYAPPNGYPFLQFGACGMKGKDGCVKEPNPVMLVALNDAQKDFRESQVKKMREEICKPS